MNLEEFAKTIPDEAMKRINKIVQKTGVDLYEVLEEYYEIFMDDFIQKDPQFKSDYDRHDYASRVLYARWSSRGPVKKFEIIPIGYSRPRRTRIGDIVTLYAIVKNRGLTPILCTDRFVNIHEYVNLFTKYTAKLNERPDGTLMAGAGTRFKDPEPINMDPTTLLEKLNIPRITIAEADKNPSRKRSDGRTDDTDWRVIRGLIIRQFRGTDKNGLEFGVYTIIDDTIEPEHKILPDGRVLPPGFTVWVPPSMMKWTTESELDFYGTVEIDQNGIPYMNCYLIVPIHGIPIEESE